MMQVNSSSQITLEENAQMMLMIVFGVVVIQKHQTQAMLNGGVSCMNGMNAKIQQ